MVVSTARSRWAECNRVIAKAEDTIVFVAPLGALGVVLKNFWACKGGSLAVCPGVARDPASKAPLAQ